MYDVCLMVLVVLKAIDAYVAMLMELQKSGVRSSEGVDLSYVVSSVCAVRCICMKRLNNTTYSRLVLNKCLTGRIILFV